MEPEEPWDRTPEETLRVIRHAVLQALTMVAGSNWNEDMLRSVADSTVSLTCHDIEDVHSMPWNVQVKAGAALFHRGVTLLRSPLGLERSVDSPDDVSRLLLPHLEAELPGCRIDATSVLQIVTPTRLAVLYRHGKLPCRFCSQWCKGSKGLWWHEQEQHGIDHAEATETAVNTNNALAMVVHRSVLPVLAGPLQSSDEPTPFDHAASGNLQALKADLARGFDPHSLDRHGATLVLWAAGGGHVHVLEYLVHDCHCDPRQPQQGRRSFAGRTALHWAARKGHVEAVQWLLPLVSVHAATQDGTTALGWAAWQGHQEVMEILVNAGAYVSSVNSFGCNAALWAAQGPRTTVSVLEFLAHHGCSVTAINNNGHGVLHKACQRGNRLVCEWFVEHHLGDDVSLVAPDEEDHVPSDLAGMEGHECLARWMANIEISLVSRLSSGSSWLEDKPTVPSTELVWEAGAGLRRMQTAFQRRSNPRHVCLH